MPRQVELIEGFCENHVYKETPESILIATPGHPFMDGVLDSIKAAGKRTAEAGYVVDVYQVKNICIMPFHGVGAMRNMGIMEALIRKHRWLLIIDTDIRMDDPDTILKLIRAGKHCIMPWLDQSLFNGQYFTITNVPMVQPGQGLVQLDWAVINCMLFDTLMFRTSIGPYLFQDTLTTNEEAYIFQRLRMENIQLWQDTDTRVTMLRPTTKMWEVLGQKCPNPNDTLKALQAQEIKQP